jgi:hypothetical protein
MFMTVAKSIMTATRTPAPTPKRSSQAARPEGPETRTPHPR